MNGQTFIVTYFVEDDQGGMTQITLQPNFASGAGTVMLPSSGIRMATISGTASAFDFLIDNISFVAEAQEFTISFSAFIPSDSLEGPRLEFCFFGMAPPELRRLFFKGDNRSFDAASAFDPDADNFRVRQLVTVITDEVSDPDGLKEGTDLNLVGETRSYASDALDDGVIDENDEDGVALDCTLFHNSRTAQPNFMVIDVSRLTPTKLQIDLDGGPGMPLSVAAQMLATLDWDFTITIDTQIAPPEWTLTGRHDGFPAYELYINDGTDTVQIYTHSPGEPPFTAGDAMALLPPLDINVGNISGTLP